VLSVCWKGLLSLTPQYLDEFISDVHPNIKVSYIGLSCDSDHGFEPRHIPLLQSEKVLHWFACNCNIAKKKDTGNLYSKFSCLPNGLSQWNDMVDHIHEMSERGIGLYQGRLQPIAKPISNLVLVSFAVSTNPTEREPAWNYFCGRKKWVTCQYGLRWDQLYTSSSSHGFVVSPNGVGLDCFRTYEILHLGSYPIVRSSNLDEIYEALPVLIVEKWQDVTEELLRTVFAVFRNMRFDFGRLYKGFWERKIYDHRPFKEKACKIEYRKKG